MDDELKKTILNAIQDNDLTAIHELIKNRRNLTTLISGSYYLIHGAAQKGRVEIIKIILKAYPDLLNQKDVFNQTPLRWAASRGHEELVIYLISLGAELNSATHEPETPYHGKTALHWAIDGNYKTIVSLLLKAGARVDELLLKKKAFQNYLKALIEDNNANIIQVLISNPKTLTIPIDECLCLIHHAAELGRLDLIKIILKTHPDLLNQKDELNQTPLIWAASRGHEELVIYLISLEAELNNATNNPNSPNHGKTAVHYAMDGNYTTLVNCLLNAGARIDELLLKNEKFQSYQTTINNPTISSVSHTFFHKRLVKKSLPHTADDFDWLDQWSPVAPR